MKGGSIMISLRQAHARYTLNGFPSVRTIVRNVSEQSLLRALIKYRHMAYDRNLGTIRRLFEGGTSEEEEDRALAILVASENAAELIFYVNNLTWDTLDDELDESDLDQIAQRLRDLLDQRDYIVHSILRRYIGNPETLQDRPIQEILHAATGLSPDRRHALTDEVVFGRIALLDGVAVRALRGLPTGVREFKAVIDFIQATQQHLAAELFQLSWEVFYTDRICSQLQRGECSLLLKTLPELVDPSFSAGRRFAFFDMLRRWEKEFLAFEALVNALGDERQKADMRNFMEKRRLFMDNFPQQLPPAPGGLATAIQNILNVISGVTGGFQELVAAVQIVAQTVGGFNIPELFGTADDDIAVNATNSISQDLLARLPFGYKLELINRMMDGAVEDEEEQAILRILKDSKARSAAEFLQLAAAVTWERLFNKFDGSEYDELEGLFNF